jgi:hypothetical protein
MIKSCTNSNTHPFHGQLGLMVPTISHLFYRVWGYYGAKMPHPMDVCCYKCGDRLVSINDFNHHLLTQQEARAIALQLKEREV